MTKFEAIDKQVKRLAAKMDIGLLEAAARFQAAAAKADNEELITDIHKYKMKIFNTNIGWSKL